MVAVSEYMCSIRGSAIVSSADVMLDMSVVRWVRGVGGVCEMFMCLVRRGERGR